MLLRNENIYNSRRGKCVVSDSEVLVMFVTLVGKGTVRIISERPKVRQMSGKGNKTEEI
jgi:hypothetical protein